ncbi:MAG: transcription antitermination factor NusB [Clostridia bacterium]|nr:transcription antitermination factor NusB [Clostridia bacterium]
MRTDRRRAREAAMRALYQMDISGSSPEQACEFAVAGSPDLDLPERAQLFAKTLVFGVVSKLKEIDDVIARLARDWAVDRMSPTDRNVMRIAVFEMLYLHDAPVAASIDEAVEIARLYGSAESSRFVNGILGSLAEMIKGGSGGESDARSGDGGGDAGEPRA